MVEERVVSASAYAKVNLHLWVGALEPNGFHQIASIFQMIDLHDTITILAQKGERLTIKTAELEGVSPHANTMTRSAQAFCEYVGSNATITIECLKRIPMQAGLGGGSSDAATVLKVLNELHGWPLDKSMLQKIGAQIGSDVPFFLEGSPTAFVQGRGEVVTPWPSRQDLQGLLVMPSGFGVSTAEAFAALDATRRMPTSAPSFSALQAMYTKPIEKWSFSNDFRSVMTARASLYASLDAFVKEAGKCFGVVSGSGSSYVIMSEDDSVLRRLRVKITEKWDDMWVCDIKSLHRGHSDGTVLI